MPYLVQNTSIFWSLQYNQSCRTILENISSPTNQFFNKFNSSLRLKDKQLYSAIKLECNNHVPDYFDLFLPEIVKKK